MANRIEITEGLENVVGGSFSSMRDSVNGGWKTKGLYTGRKFHLLDTDKKQEFDELLMNYPNTLEGEIAAIDAALKAHILDYEFLQ